MKNLIPFLLFTFGYFSSFSQEINIHQNKRQPLKIGMNSDEIIYNLNLENEINKNFNGGIFIGIGLLPESSKKNSDYSGVVNLHEYTLILENGLLNEWSVDSTKIGTRKCSGEYIYKGILGKTKNSWTLFNGVFNINVTAIPPTPEEKAESRRKAIEYYKEDVEKGKILIDSLVKEGYKIITKTGFDSFVIDTTSLEQVINKLGVNYRVEKLRRDLRAIYYPELGVTFNVLKKNNSEIVGFIKLTSPFKGILINDYSDSYIYQVDAIELNKTTVGNIGFDWRTYDGGKTYEAKFKDNIELIIDLEKKRQYGVEKSDIITQMKIR